LPANPEWLDQRSNIEVAPTHWREWKSSALKRARPMVFTVGEMPDKALAVLQTGQSVSKTSFVLFDPGLT